MKSPVHMTSLQRLRNLHLQKGISLLCTGINFTSSKSNLYTNGPHLILQLLRFCRTKSNVGFNGGNISENKYLEVRREAQAALLDYFHQTRSLPFVDAENMSRNAPQFLDRLLKMARINGDDGDVRRSLARFLRYHPIDEFEAFFESIGLEVCEYASFLPRDLTFLSDDQLLLQNYYFLCNYYGIERSKIGKMYREAKEVFSYDNEILKSKIQSLQNLGLPKSLVAEIIASSPHLLRGDADPELGDFLEKFKNAGIGLDWLVERMKGVDSCDWKCMLQVMSLLGELGLTGEKLGEVIMNHPDLILEGSGSCTLCLFGLLLKFGLTKSGAQLVFRQFPQVSVASFTSNLLQCYQFLVEINMSVNDIGRMVRLHPLLLGACQLKKASSIVQLLNCGVNRICKMVEEDPYLLKKWVRGVRVNRLQEPSRTVRVRGTKIMFLTRLGFVEKSGEMERVLSSLMGKADELQERSDCLVKSGLSQENVAAMLRSLPRVLNQSKDVLERKIDLLVRDLGYPVTVVVSYPILLTYTTERLKLRLVMHKWLKDEGAVRPELSLRSLMKYPEEKFVRCYVNSHPQGTRVWERLKRDVDSSPEKLGEVIMNRPDLILEGSGSCTLCLFGLLLKFGLTKSGAQSIFRQFPQVSVVSFTSNLLQCYQFLVEINMSVYDIGRMVRVHPLLLGACQLKKSSSVVKLLNCGVNRICKMVEEDPYVLKKWVRGVRVDRLQEPSRTARVRVAKTRFLTRLGFVENSGEMERVFRSLMGKADELQERSDCLVKSGLSQENVAAMLRSFPRVLNQSKDVLERKIDLLVRDLGYPVTVVVSHPILLTYTTERLKLRLVMHKWLKDEGAVRPGLSLLAFIKCSEAKFVRCYVNSHPRGARVWERLKKDADSSHCLT